MPPCEEDGAPVPSSTDEGLVVLVTGGRTWSNRHRTNEFLNFINDEVGISKLIHGNAIGADTLCKDWAIEHGIEQIPCDPDWYTDGKMSGGKVRNQRMLDEYSPDALVVFPGAGGTADMMTRAKYAARRGVDIDVWEWAKWYQLRS